MKGWTWNPERGCQQGKEWSWGNWSTKRKYIIKHHSIRGCRDNTRAHSSAAEAAAAGTLATDVRAVAIDATSLASGSSREASGAIEDAALQI